MTKHYIMRWFTYLDTPNSIEFVGPFASIEAACEWARDIANNPDDNPCWHQLDLTDAQVAAPLPVVAVYQLVAIKKAKITRSLV